MDIKIVRNLISPHDITASRGMYAGYIDKARDKEHHPEEGDSVLVLASIGYNEDWEAKYEYVWVDVVEVKEADVIGIVDSSNLHFSHLHNLQKHQSIMFSKTFVALTIKKEAKKSLKRLLRLNSVSNDTI